MHIHPYSHTRPRCPSKHGRASSPCCWTAASHGKTGGASLGPWLLLGVGGLDPTVFSSAALVVRSWMVPSRAFFAKLPSTLLHDMDTRPTGHGRHDILFLRLSCFGNLSSGLFARQRTARRRPTRAVELSSTRPSPVNPRRHRPEPQIGHVAIVNHYILTTQYSHVQTRYPSSVIAHRTMLRCLGLMSVAS